METVVLSAIGAAGGTLLVLGLLEFPAWIRWQVYRAQCWRKARAQRAAVQRIVVARIGDGTYRRRTAAAVKGE